LLTWKLYEWEAPAPAGSDGRSFSVDERQEIPVGDHPSWLGATAGRKARLRRLAARNNLIIAHGRKIGIEFYELRRQRPFQGAADFAGRGERDGLQKALEPLLKEHGEFRRKAQAKAATPDDTRAASERNKKISDLQAKVKVLEDKWSVVKNVLKK
jgi:hypothetical protein